MAWPRGVIVVNGDQLAQALGFPEGIYVKGITADFDVHPQQWRIYLRAEDQKSTVLPLVPAGERAPLIELPTEVTVGQS